MNRFADHLAVTGFVTGLRIYQRDAVGVGVVDVAEEVLVNAGGRDFDVGERACEAHGPDRTMASGAASRFVELPDELLGCDHPVGRVDQFAHLAPVDLLGGGEVQAEPP